MFVKTKAVLAPILSAILAKYRAKLDVNLKYKNKVIFCPTSTVSPATPSAVLNKHVVKLGCYLNIHLSYHIRGQFCMLSWDTNYIILMGFA